MTLSRLGAHKGNVILMKLTVYLFSVYSKLSTKPNYAANIFTIKELLPSSVFTLHSFIAAPKSTTLHLTISRAAFINTISSNRGLRPRQYDITPLELIFIDKIIFGLRSSVFGLPSSVFRLRSIYTLNLKSITSPSSTTYSFPSTFNLPASFTAASEP